MIHLVVEVFTAGDLGFKSFELNLETSELLFAGINGILKAQG